MISEVAIQQAFDLALRHHLAGRLNEAEGLYRQILVQRPDHAGAMHRLGVLAHQAGRKDIAVDLIRRAIAINPTDAGPYNNLGVVLRDHGELDESIKVCRRAIELDPRHSDAHYNLGLALASKGVIEEAIAEYRKSIAINPNYANAHINLGNVLREKGEFDEVIAAYRRAISLEPNYAEAHCNLGSILKDKGQLDEAIVSYRRAIALKPEYAAAHNNLGVALGNQGLRNEAMASFRHAIALKSDYVEAHSNLVFALWYDPAQTPQSIAEENRRWNRRHAEPFGKFISSHSNDRNPDRVLRIGYVSADFRVHPSANFLIPLMKHHDPKQVELFCYAEVVRVDAMTRRMQQEAANWRSTVGLSDEMFARKVREDRIDILVDLKLHTEGNRLLVFARKPAPIQVIWLGYPGSTGLRAIDYRLSDPYLDPPGTDESVYSEKTVRLPDTFWCFDPLDGRDVPVNALPALQTGFVTFGCLNNFSKVNDFILRVWATVLRRVEGSRLILLTSPGSHRQRTLDRLYDEGIHPERIEFVPRQTQRAYLELYHRIDIRLDCFPYNGHTTSLESFWMGVPVVSLAGKTPVSRAGWCYLSNLRMTELAGQSGDEFVRIAVDLARGLPRLQEMRSILRRRMEQSPLMDAPRFARNMEAAYRRMWQAWCEK